MSKFLNQILEYLFIKKRDPNVKRDQYTKYMHGMNRISILMFLFVLLVMLFKLVILPLIKK